MTQFFQTPESNEGNDDGRDSGNHVITCGGDGGGDFRGQRSMGRHAQAGQRSTNGAELHERCTGSLASEKLVHLWNFHVKWCEITPKNQIRKFGYPLQFLCDLIDGTTAKFRANVLTDTGQIDVITRKTARLCMFDNHFFGDFRRHIEKGGTI
ncbi:MAG: hypothetical protein Q7U45_08545 [Burkholderiaceae bacterium]|nr:hypothetical protein [Burkholderiaceae bacterium]